MAVTRPSWLSDFTAKERQCLKCLYRKYAMPQVHKMERMREECAGQIDQARCRHWRIWSNISLGLFDETGKKVSAEKIEDCFWIVIGGDDLNVIRAKLNDLIDDDSLDGADPASASIPQVKPAKYHQRRGQKLARSDGLDTPQRGHPEDVVAAQLSLVRNDGANVWSSGAEDVVSVENVGSCKVVARVERAINGIASEVAIPSLTMYDVETAPYFVRDKPPSWSGALDLHLRLIQNSARVDRAVQCDDSPVGLSARLVQSRSERVDKAVQCDRDAKDLVILMRNEHLARMNKLRLERDVFEQMRLRVAMECSQEAGGNTGAPTTS
ncbi:hypothetical protein IscW_ISCW021885 [Ixodes scapularis]|uniref:Uncharacterized protein n=1 Tax=Ixodes scapularis TaxID=6945 RepID=B7QCM0_IXOSC|nr:hypothetical protein IscW_ISCW021885 [Ixodes scapularis]|eukprot:XP_002413284.1 hypothetical protein IscW_ISCW021885 [Ixodes scapularis]